MLRPRPGAKGRSGPKGQRPKVQTTRPRTVGATSLPTILLAGTLIVVGCVGTPDPSGGAPESTPDAASAETPPARSPQTPQDPENTPAPEVEPAPPRRPEPEALAGRLGAGQAVLRPAAEEPPISAQVDVTGDGVRETVLFTVATGAQAPEDGATTLSAFSDISRTVDEAALSGHFGLTIFDVSGEAPRRVSALDAGINPVLRDAGMRGLHAAQALPVAFYFDFADARGRELVWIVHGGGERISRLVLRTDALFGIQVEDIDDDGVLDVLRSERSLEDGTGYETFVTWLKWNGREYEEFRTTNIVRNLNTFLSAAAKALGAADFAGFVERVLPAADLARLRDEGFGDIEIVDRILRPSSEALQTFRELVRREGDMESAAFPRFFENPFPRPGDMVTTPVRVVCCGGLSAVFETQLVLSENPFREPQFYFVPVEDGGVRERR